MEMQEQTYEKITGIIERKIKMMKGPVGNFFIDGEKYTCWSETYFESYNEGDEVTISYVSKENEFNGKTYINKNITHMKSDKDIEKTPFSKKGKSLLKDIGVKVDKLADPLPVLKSINGVITIGALKYKVKNVELEIIAEDNDN